MAKTDINTVNILFKITIFINNLPDLLIRYWIHLRFNFNMIFYMISINIKYLYLNDMKVAPLLTLPIL